MKPTLNACVRCGAPVQDAALCEPCERKFEDRDAQPTIDALDTIRAHDAPKVPYRVLRKGRG